LFERFLFLLDSLSMLLRKAHFVNSACDFTPTHIYCDN